MKQSDSIAELASALSKAQGQIKPAKMDKVNPFFKSNYASLGSVWDVCRKPLAENGLSIVQSPIAPLGDLNAIGLTTRLFHESGEYLEDTMYITMEESKNNAQAAGKIITYLRRYALSAMLGIVADEDTDANGEAKAPMPTEAMKKKFHALGVEVYGDEWDDKRPEFALHYGHESKSSNDLTRAEMAELIDGMIEKNNGEKVQ